MKFQISGILSMYNISGVLSLHLLGAELFSVLILVGGMLVQVLSMSLACLDRHVSLRVAVFFVHMGLEFVDGILKF